MGGGNCNTASESYTTIAGGDCNTASGYAATVGGGAENSAAANNSTIGGGYGNIASGNHATIGGGVNNTSSATNSTVSGGSGNSAATFSATVGGGSGNIASGSYATVPGGRFAEASHWGEMAYAAGQFAVPGDAQTSLYVLRQTTTNATPTELFLDGSGLRLTLAANRTMVFDILVIGFSTFGDSGGYQILGIIKNIDGVTKFVGNPTVTTLGENIVGWDVAVEDNDTHDALVIRVTGAVGATIRWVASVRTVEVAR